MTRIRVRRYLSKNLVGVAVDSMKDYRMSEDDSKKMQVSSVDTGLIVLLLLYFIKAEPSITRTKLEYYILLLDRKCFEERKIILFNWCLKGGRIKNFKKLIDFMIEKELISLKTNRSFFILEKGNELSVKYSMLANITGWMNEILNDWGDNTASSMEASVIYAESNCNYMRASHNAGSAIKSHTIQKNQKYSEETKDVTGVSDKEFFTCYEAAQILKLHSSMISASIIRKLCVRGEIDGAQRVGSVWIIPQAAVKELSKKKIHVIYGG